MKKRLGLVLLVLLALPIFLLLYRPYWHLGGLGMYLGAIGMTVSPIILFGALFLCVKRAWRDRE